MNSLCFFTFMFCVAFWSLQIQADTIETGCQFIRDNPDLIDDIVKCETDNYPERYNELTSLCLKEAAGLDKKDYVLAVCQNRDLLLEIMIKIQSCVQTHAAEILDLLPGLADGVPKAQACIKNLVEQREGAGGRVRRALGEFSQGANTAAALAEIDLLTK